MLFTKKVEKLNTTELGRKITVAYNPDKPSEAYLPGNEFLEDELKEGGNNIFTILILCVMLIFSLFLLFSSFNNKEIPDGKFAYTIEDIQHSKTKNMIKGNSIEGPVMGEVELYLPDGYNYKNLKNGITIIAYCDDTVTMSLPPQLMECTDLEILK